MEGFKLEVAERGELNLLKQDKNDAGKYRLPGNKTWFAQGDFGMIRFQHYTGNGFDLWYNRYEAEKDFALQITSSLPFLVFHAQLRDNLRCWCNSTELTEREGQYQMVHVPHLEAAANFKKGTIGETFNICFHYEFLEPYGSCSPCLGKFLESVKMQKTARLLNRACYLAPSMEDQVRALLANPYHGELADRFIKGRIHELLIVLVHHLSILDQLPLPDAFERERAVEVRKIILQDLSRHDSVEVLAGKVHTTEAALQAAFRQLYGTTVGKFSREARLKKAFELLSNSGKNRDTLLSVALSVGYNDVGNFSNAFKQYFGYSPGAIYKRSKA